MPKRGDPHPSIPGIQVDSRQATPIGGDSTTVRVVLSYRPVSSADYEGGTPEIQLGTVVTTKTTRRDVSGKLLYTIREVPVQREDGSFGVDIHYKIHEVEVQVPLVTYRVRRREKANPELRARQYVGRAGRAAGVA